MPDTESNIAGTDNCATQNYQLKSGEGLSVMFVIVWLFGDLCSFVGAILGGLLPTVIILALYVSLMILFP